MENYMDFSLRGEDEVAENRRLELDQNQNNHRSPPLQIHLILTQLAKHLDYKTLKSSRTVCSSWNDGFKSELLKRTECQCQKECVNLYLKKSLLPAAPPKNKKLYLKLRSNFTNSILDCPLQCPFLTNWFSYYGEQLTNLTIGSEETRTRGILGFLLTPLAIRSLLEEWCPNLKYLTVINSLVAYKGGVLPQTKCPTINLTRLTLWSNYGGLTILSGKWLIDPNPSFTYFTHNPLKMVAHFLEYVASVKTLKLEPRESEGIFKAPLNLVLPEYEVTWAQKVFQNVVNLSINNKTFSDNYVTTLLVPKNSIFPKLQGLNVRQVGAIKFEGDNCNKVFPQLQELYVDFYSHFSRSLVLTRLSKLGVYFSGKIFNMENQNLEFLLNYPNLSTLELREDGNDTCVQPDYLFESGLYPNIKELKLRLTELKLDQIFKCFPNLEVLDVDLTGKRLVNEFDILSGYSTLEHLIIVEDSDEIEFELAMETHFYKFLTGLRRLHIKTFNKDQTRRPTFWNIFTVQFAEAPSVSVTPPVSLASVLLEGFTICSKEYEEIRNLLRFDLALYNCN